jgi:amidophosphoribosyltransferase
VHNGSLSNPYEIRRMLEPRGIAFETDCDTEAACRFLEWRTREGDDLRTALTRGFDVFDGFYTFLMGDATQLALVRDTFACKPAVVAEHADWVAIASEFHALAHLPGIEAARIFEPVPEQIYVWRADGAGAAASANATAARVGATTTAAGVGVAAQTAGGAAPGG